MHLQVLIDKLTELEESVRVNRLAISNILAVPDMDDASKLAVIKQLTTPLVLSYASSMAHIKEFIKESK